MEEGFDNGFYDYNKCNFIEDNETRVNDEDEYSTEVEKKEDDVTTDYEINIIAKNDDNRNAIYESKNVN